MYGSHPYHLSPPFEPSEATNFTISLNASTLSLALIFYDRLSLFAKIKRG